MRENNWAKTHNSTDPSQDASTKKMNQNIQAQARRRDSLISVQTKNLNLYRKT